MKAQMALTTIHKLLFTATRLLIKSQKSFQRPNKWKAYLQCLTQSNLAKQNQTCSTFVHLGQERNEDSDDDNNNDDILENALSTNDTLRVLPNETLHIQRENLFDPIPIHLFHRRPSHW
jgi:hypothetical protein